MSIQILNVHDAAFAPYGKVLTGYDTTELVNTLASKTPCPEDGTVYEASSELMESLEVFGQFKRNAYAGMEIQMGFCNGANTKLNALEYHRGSELNIPSEDIVLLLAKVTDITPENTLDPKVVKAFRIPKGTVVQIYETTLHFAPCCNVENGSISKGFHVAVVLPRGTNTPLGEHSTENSEDKLLWMKNKWLIAHRDSKPASRGAFVGITGENIDISK